MSYVSSQWEYPIIAGGLERLGVQSYSGKGFYVGNLHTSQIVFAVQGEFGLYEGKVTAGYAEPHEWTLVYNKTESSVKFYIQGILKASAVKIHNIPGKALPITYADFLVIGSRYSHQFRLTTIQFSDVKFWRQPLTENEVMQTNQKSRFSLFILYQGYVNLGYEMTVMSEPGVKYKVEEVYALPSVELEQGKRGSRGVAHVAISPRWSVK